MEGNKRKLESAKFGADELVYVRTSCQQKSMEDNADCKDRYSDCRDLN